MVSINTPIFRADETFAYTIAQIINGDGHCDDTITDQLMIESLYRALNQLPIIERQVIIARYIDKHSRHITARELNMSTKSVILHEQSAFETLRQPEIYDTLWGKTHTQEYNALSEENEKLKQIIKDIKNNRCDIADINYEPITGDCGRRQHTGKDISIEGIGLDPKTVTHLTQNGYATLGSIAAVSEDKLLTQRRIGPKTVSKLKNILKRHGLKLNDKTLTA